jgi:hypothetical protein
MKIKESSEFTHNKKNAKNSDSLANLSNAYKRFAKPSAVIGKPAAVPKKLINYVFRNAGRLYIDDGAQSKGLPINLGSPESSQEADLTSSAQIFAIINDPDLRQSIGKVKSLAVSAKKSLNSNEIEHFIEITKDIKVTITAYNRIQKMLSINFPEITAILFPPINSDISKKCYRAIAINMFKKIKIQNNIKYLDAALEKCIYLLKRS